MKVPILNAYTNPYLNEGMAEQLGNQGKVVKQTKNGSIDTSQASKVNLNSSNTETVVTKKERDFFIRMFPENSEQLEKHVLFNRNGRLQTHNISKGMIVDGRV